MPRHSSLPELERQIASRFREARLKLKAPRSYVGFRTGVDGAAISRIELGRTPLKYDIAYRFCNEFAISPSWLFSGREEDAKRHVYLSSSELLGIAGDELFSEIFKTRVSNYIPKSLEPTADPSDSKQLEASAIRAAELIIGVDTTLVEVLDTAGTILEKRPFRELMWGRVVNKLVNYAIDRVEQLDKIQEVEYCPAMHPTWVKLRSDILKATAMRGQRAALARFLGVNQSSVNSWLDDRREPGADVTLKLLRWLAMEGAKQKRVERKLSPPAPTTQLENQNAIDPTQPDRKKQ